MDFSNSKMFLTKPLRSSYLWLWGWWAPAGFQEGLRSEGGNLGSSISEALRMEDGCSRQPGLCSPLTAALLTLAELQQTGTIKCAHSNYLCVIVHNHQEVHLCSQGAWAAENEWQNIRRLVWIISAPASSWKTCKCNVAQHRQQEATCLRSSRRPLPLEDRAMKQADLPPETAGLQPMQQAPANIQWDPWCGCSQQEGIFAYTPAAGHTGLIGMIWIWIASIRGGGTAFGLCCPVLPVWKRSNWDCWVRQGLGTRPSLEFISGCIYLFFYYL